MWTRLIDKKRQRLTLPRFTAVPSALVGLTSLFGMGRGDPHRYSHLKVHFGLLPKVNIVDNVDERVLEYSSEHKGSSFFDLDYYQLIILKRSGN